MNRTEFKAAVVRLLQTDMTSTNWDEKVAIIRQCIIELDQQQGHDETNKGKSWTDAELRVILTTAPTKENCMKLARAFRRGYGSIEQIYRWAASSEDEIQLKRPEDAFIKQIKRVAKEVGWRAT